MKQKNSILMALFCIALVLTGCESLEKEASYPTKAPGGKIVYTDQERETIWGEGRSVGDLMFGKGESEQQAGGIGIGVNSYLWRATLDTLSFMPISSADPFGGVILSDWYENPETPGERFKINVYILDKQLRADGLNVSVFKQVEKGNQWKDVKVADSVAFDLETAILTRARELRVQSQTAN